MYVSSWLKHTRQNGECLVWTRCVSSDGYPRAYVRGNPNVKVHREVFFDVNGFYPEVVRHTCDNPRCINPDHLISGSNLDNIRDRVLRGRSYNHVTKELYESCKSLRDTGKTYKEVSEQLEMEIKRVEYILTRWRKES